ncbi:Ribosomal protein L14p/L23e family protein [Candida albicans]|uniref:Ribosomal protein L14p/L23e family protein n=1 Tax=Candida albicans TaxID=5476 RepID=A0A8H6BW71_CANAX|nr:Ribosomal protein L14p/L23e family protein [Candida albicans]
MIYLKSLLNVIDNSGAQVVECIKVLRRPLQQELTGQSSTNRVKRRDICQAVVVRTRAPLKRKDGSVVRFDDNACVLINKNGEPLGTRISSVVAKELKDLNYNKIVALAPKTF